MDKHCPKCQMTLPPSEFGLDPNTRDGLTGWCVKCHRVAVNAGYRKQRDQVVAHLGGVCVTCGYDADTRALQIDHINGGGAEERRSAGNWRQALRNVLTYDGTKYQLLCGNCNAIKRIESEERGRRIYTRKVPIDGRPDKWCPRCTACRAAVDFYVNSARSDGLSSYCAPCMAESMAASYQQLRTRVVEHLGDVCRQCGYSDDERALAIDHVNGGGVKERKSGRVHRAVLNAALADQDGCYQLLCSNCNIIKRFDQSEHGARVYERAVPTERIDRPNRRWTPEARAAQSAYAKNRWNTDTEYAEKVLGALNKPMNT